MTEFEHKNSFEPNKIHVNVSEIDKKESSDKMDEGILSVESSEPNSNNESISGFNNKLTSEKMDDDEFSNESFEPTKPSASDISCKLSNEIDNQIDSRKRFQQNSVHSTLLTNKSDNDMHLNELDGGIISDMEVENQNDPKLNSMKDNVLDCVAKSNGFFKSQQVGESDLTFSEKREIASNLLIKSLPLFLQRYWKFIEIEDVPYFDAYRSNYEINFYISEIIKLHNSRTKKVRIKNRRYEALKKMVDEGSYFSDAEMKKRNPFTYDQMIGQHLTEKERVAAYKEQYPDKNFSAFLMNQMEKNIENCLFERQKNEDEAIVEEEDDDTEEEESELEDDEPVKIAVTAEEKKQLRSEFTNIMYESFLDGKDIDFDYSSVDNNVEFDSVQQRDIDEEEKYFDEESSHSSN